MCAFTPDLTDLPAQSGPSGNGLNGGAEPHWPGSSWRTGMRLTQPLLLLALGGTGRQIATRVKAAFIERYGVLPENVAIVAFDSADDPISVRETRHGRVVTLDRESEFFLLDRVPLAGIKRSLARHPEIAARLNGTLNRIQRASIHDGTAQERPQGLLALLWNAATISRVLNTTVRRLAERNEDLRADVEAMTGFNVALVGSTCGGQNSGGMLDLAYLVRELLRGLGDLADSSRLLGMLALPGAFPGVHGPNLQPNTHAFFRELDQLMQGAGFSADYPGGMRVRSLERPFDCVFVLDGVDERGKAWPNLEEVCALGAKALALLLSTDVGLREIFNAVNDQGVLHNISAAGYGTYLGTVGQAVLRFPAQQIADRLALRQAQALANVCLTGAPAAALEAAELTAAAALRERLRLNASGTPFEARLTPPASLEQAAPEEQPPLARTLATNYLQRRIYGDAFSQMQETVARLSAELLTELTARQQTLAAGGYLTPWLAWLNDLQAALQTQHAALLTEAEQLAGAAEQAQKVLESAGTAMDQAAEALFLWRKSQVRSAVGRYLDDAGQLAQLRLAQRATELAAEIVLGALQEVRRRRQAAAEATLRGQQARDRLAAHGALLARLTDGRNEISLAEPELIETLYRRYVRPAEALLPQIAAELSVADWGKLSADKLAERLATLAGQAFEPVRLLTVEQVLTMPESEPVLRAADPADDGTDRQAGRSAQQWISRLAELAAGAWNLDKALLPGGGAGQASFLTIGVPDATTSIFANSGYTLVSTHDPERIIALRTVYGASFDTLKAAPQWQQAYAEAIDRTPLHVLAVSREA